MRATAAPHIANSFERLRLGWLALRQARIEQERAYAPRHNLIRFLGLQRAEVGFHSPFLRDLLDPYGTHGQGTLFLQNFLRVLGDHALRAGTKWDYRWRELGGQDSAEWVVLGESGRIDISIRNRAQKILVFLENKIDAIEQHRQLARYKERLEEERYSFDHRLLILLCRRGYPNPTSGEPDIRITYEDDIAGWIEHVSEQLPTTAVTLRGSLAQYADIVRQLGGSDEMSDDDALIALITQRENLECALEIAEGIEKAKGILRLRFWQNLAQNLKSELEKIGLQQTWSIYGLGELEQTPSADYQGIWVALHESQSFLHLRFGAFLEHRRIYCGVWLSSRQSADVVKIIRPLRQKLPAEWPGPDDWWIGYYDTGFATYARSFLLDAAADVVAISQPMAESIIDVLRTDLTEVIRVSESLKALQESETMHEHAGQC